VLGLRAYRQQLIASNIANADTPGYKAVDIDFQEALRIARSVANSPPLKLSATHSGHIVGRTALSPSPYPLKHHISSQTSLDRNTVEMDVEPSKFAQNSMMREFARDRVSGHSKMMMEWIQNLKD
jgi:flagellar basal-body rod protein FlgB